MSRAKTDEFAAALSDLESQVQQKDSCVKTVYLVAGAIPIVVLILLVLLKPGFVMKKDGDTKKRDRKKILLWTAGLTTIAWAAMFLYHKKVKPLTGKSFCMKM